MCRLAAYAGSPIALDQVITRPLHSLLQQSMHANEAKLAVNGDGFGIAWYGHLSEPGLFRDVLPAWSDINLQSVCKLVQAPLFMAHVRASTSGETSRANCHPFNYRNWSFMHNGQIAGYAAVRRQLESRLPDALYHARQGTTDSELFFLLLLANGLEENCQRAVERSLQAISAGAQAAKGPNRLTCVFSDGVRLYGFRYASDCKSPTLYTSRDFLPASTVVASEPLNADDSSWLAVPEGSFFSLPVNGAGDPQISRLAVPASC